jgi:hypothetical protein
VYISYIFRSETHWVTLGGKSGQSTGQPSAKRCQICWKLSVRWLFWYQPLVGLLTHTTQKACCYVWTFFPSWRINILSKHVDRRTYRNIPFVTTSSLQLCFVTAVTLVHTISRINDGGFYVYLFCCCSTAQQQQNGPVCYFSSAGRMPLTRLRVVD